MGLGELSKSMNENKQPEHDSLGADKLAPMTDEQGQDWTDMAMVLVNKLEQLLEKHSWAEADLLVQEALRQAHARGLEEKAGRPQIVTLCGSSRFVAEMAVIAWELEKDGHIVFSLHLLPDSYTQQADHQAEFEGVAEQMDELHLRKIDMSDKVMIVNIGGYIGDSTSREIEYARKAGKSVKFLEPRALKEGGQA